MLISFKDDYEKISMGLLSYTPDLKEMPRLKEEFQKYKEDDKRSLFLWRSGETDDFCGLVGVEVQSNLILLRHIAITPSYRNEGLTFEILDELNKKFKNKNIVGTIDTGGIVTSWQKNKSGYKDEGKKD